MNVTTSTTLAVILGGVLASTTGCSAPGAPSGAPLRQAFPDQAARILETKDAFVVRGGGFATDGGPDVAAGLGRRALSIALPASAEQEIVFHAIGGFEARVREVGASGRGTIVENAVAYSREGGTSYWSAAEHGYEEWVMLAGGRARGAAPAVAWQVSGATLRQEGDSIALTDASGVVRVRVTAPAAYEAGGRQVTAHLAAHGTDIELSVDTEEPVLIDPLWKPEAVLNIGRAAHTATLLPNGKVLVVGGLSAQIVDQNSAEIYDPATNHWAFTKTHMITPRSEHTATLLTTGKVLVVGGDDQDRLHTLVELYDPTLDTWTSETSTNARFFTQTATLLSSGKVLLTVDEAGLAELYDPTTHTWSNAGRLNLFRRSHTATLLPFAPLLDTVLVAGGTTLSDGQPTQSAETWNPTQMTWTQITPMNVARAGHTATVIARGKVLVAGGVQSAVEGKPPVYTATGEVYDPSTGLWSPSTNSMSLARASHTAALLQSGQVLVTGGFTVFDPILFSDGTNYANADLFDPITNTWSQGLPMNVARSLHTATTLPNGTVLEAGGFTNNTPTTFIEGAVIDSTELYEPCVCSDGRLCPNGFQSQCCLCSDGTACPGGDHTQCSPTFSCKAPNLPCPCSGGPNDGICICLSSGSKCAQFCGGKGGTGPACTEL